MNSICGVQIFKSEGLDKNRWDIGCGEKVISFFAILCICVFFPMFVFFNAHIYTNSHSDTRLLVWLFASHLLMR